MSTEIQLLQNQINKLRLDMQRSAEIVRSTVPLTGPSKSCCAKFGINITTGIQYFVDANGNWQQAV